MKFISKGAEPQNNRNYEQMRFEYQNMLASCQCDKKPREPQYCGYTKGDWFEEDMIISPLDRECESHFRYTADGCIYPAHADDIAAQATIDILSLNIDRLRALRREAIEGVLDVIEELTQDEIHQLIKGYQEKDRDGKFTPFCMAIVYILSLFCESR